MTLRGTFAIEGSFKIPGRGIVIYGDIIVGVVSKQDVLFFLDNDQEIKLKISDINFLDRVCEDSAKVGLTFYYDSDEQKKRLNDLRVTAQTAKILTD